MGGGAEAGCGPAKGQGLAWEVTYWTGRGSGLGAEGGEVQGMQTG
jgi:hypothetical protein